MSHEIGDSLLLYFGQMGLNILDQTNSQLSDNFKIIIIKAAYYVMTEQSYISAHSFRNGVSERMRA